MKKIRQHLGWKLFLSYLTVILIGVFSLAVAAEWHAPSALSRHMSSMQTMMAGIDSGMMQDLLEDFRTAINEVLLVSAGLAVITAVIVSTFVTRRIIQPIQEMTAVSQRIANGHYDERVQISGEDELAKLGISFNRMAHQLEQTEDRRRQLIGDVAHELRTPLSSIKSVMEGLQDGVLPADPETFGSVEREVNRLQRIVRDLEELSRAEAGELPMEMAPVNPADFGQTAVDRLRLQFEDKNVQLHAHIPPDLPPVQADAARMTQVMLNLLGNALQYTPSGGEVSVQFSLFNNQSEHCPLNTENCILITVKDTGIGLTAEQQRHIFERFYRVDKSRARTGGGSGIGLTISKHIVEAHNGRLTVTSPGPGKGSVFTVWLPIAH
ncbi:MAG TPA: HAMP domain-containing protein [Anaerolineae bacterium]|nr:HAMP domain-containing protein [Anaerolineae bacterium]